MGDDLGVGRRGYIVFMLAPSTAQSSELTHDS